jgi:hypothetical protein
VRDTTTDIQKESEDDEEENSSDDEESVVDESDPWTVMLSQLREYWIMNGNCNVPQHNKNNPKLGKWVNRQRAHYKGLKNGKGKKIKPERIIRLERFGFIWNTKETPPASWDDNL